MKPFYLVETVTRDKLIHQGIFYKPKNPGKPASAKASANRALLWMHGLTSTFYGNLSLIEAFAEKCEEMGFGFASFNNRGHDIVTGLKKVDWRKPKGYARLTGGAAYEKFSDCVYDIEAGINFLIQQGFQKVVIIGHSTGANKVCYFAGSNKHLSNVLGFILASPVSDRLDPSLNQIKFEKDMTFMQDLMSQSKGDVLIDGVHVFPITPRRFLSSFTPNSLEDQFDYGDLRPRMTYFSRIRKPLMVIIGDKDEYLDRSARKFLGIFAAYQHSTNYKSVIIHEGLHSYSDKEKNVASIICDWVKSLE